MRRVVVTGIDCLTSLGSTEETWDGLLHNRHAYQPLPEAIGKMGEYRAKTVSFIPDFKPSTEIGMIRADRFIHIAATSALGALADAQLDLGQTPAERTGVILGSGTGAVVITDAQLVQFYEINYRKVNPYSIPMVTLNSLSGQLSIFFGARGPNLSVSTACSSGNQAISLAYDAIAMNRADVMITGASESPTSPLCYTGFEFLRVMAPDDVGCHPFSKDRCGFVMGEGAGILVLESLEHALARNARIYAEVAGFSMTCDAHHIMMPYPDGDYVEDSMRKALQAANLSTLDVDYINAHGTATVAGDRTEVLGIERLFGSRAADIPVSSIKGGIGHTLGASGAIEAVVSLLAMRDQKVPPTVNYSEPDPELQLDFVTDGARDRRLDVVMSNSFGFGGNNSTIVFKRWTE
ncbi:MAG: beta-ketoacyl-[acyl-carrier-protein] synthase family protein [Paenibacillaceae bacterium]|nr:beta-ketoacyl-[acyl-carrier-protein] synthase family protein [Paenibacillaceae bacterium]